MRLYSRHVDIVAELSRQQHADKAERSRLDRLNKVGKNPVLKHLNATIKHRKLRLWELMLSASDHPGQCAACHTLNRYAWIYRDGQNILEECLSQPSLAQK